MYSGVTFAGYIGILTGQKPYAFTVTLDERDKGFEWENIFQLLLAKTTPVGFFLRSLLASEDSHFDYAVQEISRVEMIAPAYIILGGVQKGEGAVITRARTKAIDVWKLDVTDGRLVGMLYIPMLIMCEKITINAHNYDDNYSR